MSAVVLAPLRSGEAAHPALVTDRSAGLRSPPDADDPWFPRTRLVCEGARQVEHIREAVPGIDVDEIARIGARRFQVRGDPRERDLRSEVVDGVLRGPPGLV